MQADKTSHPQRSSWQQTRQVDLRDRSFGSINPGERASRVILDVRRDSPVIVHGSVPPSCTRDTQLAPSTVVDTQDCPVAQLAHIKLLMGSAGLVESIARSSS
jgi:hypothetical protein